METASLFVRPRPKLAEAIEGCIKDGTVQGVSLHLRPGEALFRSGESIRTTFYIQRGMVKLFSVNGAGETKTVFLHKAGTLIGFQTLQQTEGDVYPSILNAEATSTCDICALNAAQFKRFLVEHGDIGYEMSCYLFDMMAQQTRENVNGSIYSVLERFASLLLAIARELNLPQAPAVIPFANAELAAMLGVHPNSVTNAIAALRKAECVERQHNCLVITDYRKLKQVAGDLVAGD